MASIGAAQLEQALAGGTEFLLDRQGADGLWRDFETLAGEASDWPTGFIGTQLYDAGVRGAPIDRAVEALVRRQHPDGGWGYHRGVPTDADSTAWVLMLLAAVAPRHVALERAVRCLERHHDPRTGGVATYADPTPIRRYLGGGPIDVQGWCASHLEVTATAGRAFAAVPNNHRRAEADLAWQFVARRQARDGGWDSYWWVDRHYPTLQAAALAEAVGQPAPATRSAAWLVSLQLPEGCWGATEFERSAFATAVSLSVLTRAGGHDEAAQRGLLGLVALQEPDGGWPGQASMRIPPPHIVEPDGYESWRADALGTGVVVHDHRRLFTTAACVAALALAAGPRS